jgi:hypothetical protein
VSWWLKPEIALYIAQDRVLARMGKRGLTRRVRALAAAQVPVAAATSTEIIAALAVALKSLNPPLRTRVVVYMGGAHLEAGNVRGDAGASVPFLEALAQRAVRLSRGDDAPAHHIQLLHRSPEGQALFVAADAELLEDIRTAVRKAGCVLELIVPWISTVIQRAAGRRFEVREPGILWRVKDAAPNFGLELHHLAEGDRFDSEFIPVSDEPSDPQASRRLILTLPEGQDGLKAVPHQAHWLRFGDCVAVQP